MKPISPAFVGLLVVLCLGAFAATVWTLRLEPLPIFSDLEVKEKKSQFFAYLTPKIEKVNREVLRKRQSLEALAQVEQLNWWQQRKLQAIANEYHVEIDPQDPSVGFAELLNRVDMIPPPLALIQAAKESAWGTSRFAVQGNNLFGQQCFTSGCGFTPRARTAGKQHEVARFASPQEAVAAYIKNLNTHPRYSDLRDLRAAARANNQTLTGTHLANGLLAYSERRDDYVEEVKSMIRQNELE